MKSAELNGILDFKHTHLHLHLHLTSTSQEDNAVCDGRHLRTLLVQLTVNETRSI